MKKSIKKFQNSSKVNLIKKEALKKLKGGGVVEGALIMSSVD